jgi:hypothetical protein
MSWKAPGFTLLVRAQYAKVKPGQIVRFTP